MIRTLKIVIKPENKLFGYFQDMCIKYRNMYNVANFYIRQNMTGLKKAPGERQPNESEVISLTTEGLEKMNKRNKENAKSFDFPTAEKWFLPYYSLDAIFKVLDNTDYRAMPAQMAQSAIKSCCQSWKSYFAALKAYKRNKLGFTGVPKIPKYKKSGLPTITFPNQAASLCSNENGKTYIKFVKTPHKLWIKEGLISGKILQTVVVPSSYGMAASSFTICLAFEDGTELPEIHKKEESKNIAAIDPGIENFTTITDNVGNRPIIIKGTALKARNQWYNKTIAKLQNMLERDKDNRVLENEHNVLLQKRISQAYAKRERFFNDCFHKIAKHVVEELASRNIDTLVFGWNEGIKQSPDMGKTNNQNFVQIPILKYKNMLQYLCARKGILFIQQEESYTSKASFLDGDSIPYYKKEESKTTSFSGRRICRGLYQSRDGRLLNADVNGSMNILRKAFPDIAFPEETKALMNVKVWA